MLAQKVKCKLSAPQQRILELLKQGYIGRLTLNSFFAVNCYTHAELCKCQRGYFYRKIVVKISAVKALERKGLISVKDPDINLPGSFKLKET